MTDVEVDVKRRYVKKSTHNIQLIVTAVAFFILGWLGFMVKHVC